MNENLREAMLLHVCEVLRRSLPDAWSCYVFGSVARGEERADSDLESCAADATTSNVDALIVFADRVRDEA